MSQRLHNSFQCVDIYKILDLKNQSTYSIQFYCNIRNMVFPVQTLVNSNAKILKLHITSAIKRDKVSTCHPLILLIFFQTYIVCIGVSPPSLFLDKPPLNRQTVEVPPFLAIPLYIGFSWTPPWKSGLSVNPQNIKVFHP